MWEELVMFHFIAVKLVYRICLESVNLSLISCPISIWLLFYGATFVTWEKIQFLHAQMSPSCCCLIQVSDSLPSSLPSASYCFCRPLSFSILFQISSDWFSIICPHLFQCIILMQERSAQGYIHSVMPATTNPPSSPPGQQSVSPFFISFLRILYQL